MHNSTIHSRNRNEYTCTREKCLKNAIASMCRRIRGTSKPVKSCGPFSASFKFAEKVLDFAEKVLDFAPFFPGFPLMILHSGGSF